MKRCFVVWLSLLACLPSLAAERPSSLGPVVTAFIAFTKDTLKQGNELFDTLATMQSEAVISDLCSDAREMKDEKSRLRKQLMEGRVDAMGLQTNVNALQRKVERLRATLNRFARQIEKVTQLKASPLISRSNELASSKFDELREILQAYESNDPDRREKAVQRLDNAIADMDGFQKAAECLLQTIQTKSAACDPELKPTLAKRK